MRNSNEQRNYLFFFITSKYRTKITVQLNQFRAANIVRYSTPNRNFLNKFFRLIFGVLFAKFHEVFEAVVPVFDIDSRYEKKKELIDPILKEFLYISSS